MMSQTRPRLAYDAPLATRSGRWGAPPPQHPLPAPGTIATESPAATGTDFYFNPYTLELIATGVVAPMPANETEAGNNTIQDL